jgi:transcriptional regulator with XRE-family HTH domain
MLLLASSVQQQIGRRVRDLRLTETWTQDELAERAGVGRATVDRLERTGTTTVKNLLRIAEALGALDTFEAVLAPPPPVSIAAASAPIRHRGRRRNVAR